MNRPIRSREEIEARLNEYSIGPLGFEGRAIYSHDYREALRWVLEDSEPKPIKKVSCGSNISVVEIAIRLNEIIDRLNGMTKA